LFDAYPAVLDEKIVEGRTTFHSSFDALTTEFDAYTPEVFNMLLL
jgi:hypothetical protein